MLNESKTNLKCKDQNEYKNSLIFKWPSARLDLRPNPKSDLKFGFVGTENHRVQKFSVGYFRMFPTKSIFLSLGNFKSA